MRRLETVKPETGQVVIEYVAKLGAGQAEAIAGGPLCVGPYAGKRDEIFEEWKGYIDDLAACPNVVAKLGGLNMDFNGFGWQDRPKPPTSQELLDATRPYFEHTMDKFGVDRCMFESNFPVDKLSCGYNVLWNSFKRLTADYSADEKVKLYHDTATRIYSLDSKG